MDNIKITYESGWVLGNSFETETRKRLLRLEDKMCQGANMLIRKEPEDGWVDVNDRLPKMPFQNIDGRYSQSVLVFDEDKLMRVGYYHNHRWELASEDEIELENVTHWMPLPDPPRRK